MSAKTAGTMDAISQRPETRKAREFFVRFERENRARAAEARKNETATARIARERGWLPIARTPTPERYVSGLAALNLECPWNQAADWHTSMWRAPRTEIEERALWVEAAQWPTNAVLGTEGVYDARGALRRCRARWNIGTLGIGGHPQGYGLSPVYAAGHARAVIDMAHREFHKGENARASAAPQPLEADGQRAWACDMAQRLQDAAEPAEAALWNAWSEEIRQIEQDGSKATRRWSQGEERTT